MKNTSGRKTIKAVLLGVGLLTLVALACSFSGVERNLEPGASVQPPTAEVKRPTDPPATVAVSESPPPVSETQEAQAPASRFSGFMVKRGERFEALDFDGNPLGFSFSIPGIEDIHQYNASVFRDGLAYARYGNQGVNMVSSSGDYRLPFIQSENPISVQVKPDGSQVAWAYQAWAESTPSSEAWVANIDGSQMRKMAEISAEDNQDRWLVLMIYGWTKDNRVLIASQPTGIGGYILYGGFNGLRVYDPQSGELQVLVDDDERLMLSLNSVSDDLSKAAISFGALHIRTLATGVEVVLPALAGQTVCGSAMFSPGGDWVAYACGRNDPENEAGQVMIARTDGSSAPMILYEDGQNAPQVLGWINDDSLLFRSYQREDYAESVWRVNRDGSQLLRLGQFDFIGFIPAASP